MGAEGQRLPGGWYRITRADNAAMCKAVGATPQSDGRSHPIFYYVATQVGMGMTVGELLALCDFDVADGPMMTASEARFEGELMVETDYRVEGEIVSLVRKPSRTFGFADILRFRLTLAEDGAAPSLECTNEWILPRGETPA